MGQLRINVKHVAARARQLGRAIFGDDSGALTLEWIVIAVLLVAAVALARPLFMDAIRAAARGLK
jgi:hypothetical protein